jgi:membrane-associated phospholipid phosphatase
MQLRRWVRTFDEIADRSLDRVRGHAAADRVMYTASELGDFSLIWHIVGVAQALRPGRTPESALRASVILGVEAAIVNGPIKSLTKRTRPVHAGIRPHRLRTPRTTSFPSGHASSAFTFAGVMAPGDPLAPVYYGLAVVVASSRMYVRIHHASDVVAGAALGTALAAVARKVWPAPSP